MNSLQTPPPALPPKESPAEVTQLARVTPGDGCLLGVPGCGLASRPAEQTWESDEARKPSDSRLTSRLLSPLGEKTPTHLAVSSSPSLLSSGGSRRPQPPTFPMGPMGHKEGSGHPEARPSGTGRQGQQPTAYLSWCSGQMDRHTDALAGGQLWGPQTRIRPSASLQTCLLVSEGLGAAEVWTG